MFSLIAKILASTKSDLKAHSTLFDSQYYLLNNPDVRAAGVDPLLHFVNYGYKEGRLPLSLEDPQLEAKIARARRNRTTQTLASYLGLIAAIKKLDIAAFKHEMKQSRKKSAEEPMPPVYSNLAMTFLREHLYAWFNMHASYQWQEFDTFIQAAAQAWPRHPELLCIQGLISREMGDWPAAGSQLREAVQGGASAPGLPETLAEVDGILAWLETQDEKIRLALKSDDIRKAQRLLQISQSIFQSASLLEALIDVARKDTATDTLENSLYDLSLIRRLRPQWGTRVADLRKQRLLLLDTSFPSPLSSFRFGEFDAYLQHIPESFMMTAVDSGLSHYGDGRSPADLIESYLAESEITESRLFLRRRNRDLSAKAAYTVFLNLADRYFSKEDIASESHLAFTLYPGGGFLLKDAQSDEKLRKLCANPRLKKIITTQNLTYRYLTENEFCAPEKIKHIFGGVVPLALEPDKLTRIRNSRETAESRPLHFCFVAQRYSPTGKEKGYDVFVDVMKHFKESKNIYFHVVGGFYSNTIPIDGVENVIFYGPRPAAFFPEFYAKMDGILSASISHSLLDPQGRGSFDGFPTTCVVEAGLHGAAVFTTDLHDMNSGLDGNNIFEPGREIEIISRDSIALCHRLEYYLSHRSELRDLGERGALAFQREFSFEKQLEPRISLMRELLE